MPQNTAFVITNVINDQAGFDSQRPSASALTEALRQAGKIAIRARLSGRIYAESIGLGSRAHQGRILHEFWRQDEEQISEPDKAPQEVLENCWTTTQELIHAARGTNHLRPDFLINNQKVLRGNARTYITTLEESPDHITIQVEFK